MISESRVANLFLVIFVVLVISLLAKVVIFPNDSPAIAISLLSLIVAIASNFRNELFPLQLAVSSGNMWFFLPNKSKNEFILILEMVFLNQGYADGVIKAILVKVTDSKGHKKLYATTDEMDANLVREIFLNIPEDQRRGTFNLFGPFPIHSKQSIKKFIGFYLLKEESQILEWSDDSYRFEIYISSNEWKDWKKFYEFEHPVNDEMLNACRKQGSFQIAGRWGKRLMEDMKNL